MSGEASMTLAGIPVNSIHITPDIVTELLRDAHAKALIPHHRCLDEGNRLTEISIGCVRRCWLAADVRRGHGRHGVEDYPLMAEIPVTINTRDNRAFGSPGTNAIAVVSLAILFEVPAYRGVVPPWLKDSIIVTCSATTNEDIVVTGLSDPDLAAVKAQLFRYVVQVFSGTFPLPHGVSDAISVATALEISSSPGPHARLVLRNHEGANANRSKLRPAVGQSEGAAWSAVVSTKNMNNGLAMALKYLVHAPNSALVAPMMSQRVTLSLFSGPAATVNGAVEARLSHSESIGEEVVVHGTVNRRAGATAPVAVFTVLRDGESNPATLMRYTFYALQSWSPSSEIIRASWEFGDGATLSSRDDRLALVVSHDYAIAGSYQVVLTVEDILGRTSQVTHSVVVGGLALHVARPSILSDGRLETKITLLSGHTPVPGAAITLDASGQMLSFTTGDQGEVFYCGRLAFLPQDEGVIDDSRILLGESGMLRADRDSLSISQPLRLVSSED